MCKQPIKLPFIALVIGHGGVSGDPGAVNSHIGMSELRYNTELVEMVHARLAGQKEIDSTIVHRRTYSQLPSDINSLDPDLILSFHCNAYNSRATGSEYLHYEHSKNGKRFAKILAKNISRVLKLPLRGDEGAKGRDGSDRGGLLLVNTKAPCVISEPFFIDNDSDLDVAMRKKDQLADAIVASITEYFAA